MMNNQISPEISKILLLGIQEAGRLHSEAVGPEHLLLGIIEQGTSKAVRSLQQLNVVLEDLKTDVEKRIHESGKRVHAVPEMMPLNTEASRVMKLSFLEAKQMKCEQIEPEHLLLAILRDNNNIASQVLNGHDVSYDRVCEALALKPDVQGAFGIPSEEEDLDANGISSQERMGIGQRTKTKKTSDTPVLDNFGVDLTKAAEGDKLDPVIGRETEIERIAQILSRRKKNNPILIGEPGVGKSAIVEGLALRIQQKRVPRSLFNKRIIALDMASVVAGTKYRGQFEERIQQILRELQSTSDIILFIDEIHTIVGAGSSPGTMDAANMLKPALSRGDIQCIGATTVDEYRKTIEKDGALERRFQKIMVQPTTADETLQILQNIKDKYEDHHKVKYSDEALQSCVFLTDRYISDRSFPDKAIDALDEAGSRAHLLNVEVPQSILDQEEVIARLSQSKAQAAAEQNYELAADLRDQVIDEENKLEQLRKEWLAKQENDRIMIERSHIEDVVSMMSGVPVSKMVQSESLRLKGMKQELQQKVIAQDEPIEKLVRAITRSRIGLKDPNKPIGTFMFLGPTGVGKTHLAKALAEFMFGSSDALIRIDMSEYMEKYSISRLVGAPPGYVGYDEGGQLTERVRRRPYSIILLDEIEKAHSDVFNLLLQVMDEGRLTDSNGSTVDFKNTVIIMTSNTGSRQLKEFGRGIGYNMSSAVDDKHAHGVIQKALERQFAPEFLNRIDEIITFNSLTQEAIRYIADIEIAALSKRLVALGYTFSITDDAKQYLSQKGFDPQFGARPLKRALQTYLEDAIGELIMEGQVAEGAEITVGYNKEEDKLDIR